MQLARAGKHSHLGNDRRENNGKPARGAADIRNGGRKYGLYRLLFAPLHLYLLSLPLRSLSILQQITPSVASAF